MQNVIPNSLTAWTYEAIEALCVSGLPESDKHDFKYDLRMTDNITKICCAFANTSGGFIIFGVSESKDDGFKIEGIEPDREIYGHLVAKVKAAPDIEISFPHTILVPGTSRLLYVFQVPRSARRPHLPTPEDQRIFWKRQGSSCVQMTLEEIRHQIGNYEEKREKLALLLMDLSHKLRSLGEQANHTGVYGYDGSFFSFEIMDTVVAESYAILKEDFQSIGVLDTLRKALQSLNTEKQKMQLGVATGQMNAASAASQYRMRAQGVLSHASRIVEQVEGSFKEKFGVENPYKIHGQS